MEVAGVLVGLEGVHIRLKGLIRYSSLFKLHGKLQSLDEGLSRDLEEFIRLMLWLKYRHKE